MFKDDTTILKNFIQGYVSDGKEFPLNSVQDTRNLDFFPTETKRRLPYNVAYDLEALLPEGYSIIVMSEMKFDDEAVLVVCAKNLTDANSRMRIFVNKYYNPTTEHTNHTGGSAGWHENFTEITEIYTGTINDVSGTNFETIKIANATPMSAPGFNIYYNGFFVYEDDGTDNWIFKGVVTDYTNDTTDDVFVVSLNFNTSGFTNGRDIRMVRFPVVQNNYDNWKNITQTQIIKGTDNVRIACGHGSRILWLGFIDKEFFGNAGNYTSGGDTYYKDWHGFWFGYDIPSIENKNLWRAYRPTAKSYTAAPLYHEESQFNDAVTLDELGIRVFNVVLSGTTNHPIGGANAEQYYTQIWGLTGLLDEHQEFFIKVYLGQRHELIESAGPSFAGAILNVQINIDHMLNFDRRLSGYGLYYHREDNDEPNPEIYTPLVISNIEKVDTTKMLVTTTAEHGFEAGDVVDIRHATGTFTNNPNGVHTIESIVSTTSFKVNFDLGATATYTADGQVWKYIKEIEPGENDRLLFQFDDKYKGETKITDDFALNQTVYRKRLNDYGMEIGSAFQLDAEITGVHLNSALNQEYRKDIVMKCNELIQSGSNLIAVNISDDSVSTDSENDKNGDVKIAVSQVQRGNINTHSIFADDRVKQVSLDEPVISAIGTIDMQFLIWTETKMLWYDIADEDKLVFRKRQDFEFKGIVNSNAKVRATIGGEYAGVYWASKDSIYRFIDNRPEDILIGRWRDEYQLIDEDDRNDAVAGYYPRTNEVFFLIGDTIYVWNMNYDHWKKYEYGNVPDRFAQGLTSEMVFSSGRIIYRTEAADTELYQDNTNTPITFMLKKEIDNGTKVVNKVFDRVDLIFKAEVVTDQEANLMVRAGKNGVYTDIFDRVIDFRVNNLKKSFIARKRTRGNYINIALETETEHAEFLKKFSLIEMHVNNKIGRRKLTKI